MNLIMVVINNNKYICHIYWIVPHQQFESFMSLQVICKEGSLVSRLDPAIFPYTNPMR